MLRVWVKFKDERGKKVIEHATFQVFGCETAIATASLAMDLIRGKTPEEALALSGQDLAADLGPLPPTKVHCTSLVESAIRSALAPEPEDSKAVAPVPPASSATNLIDSFIKPAQKQGGVRVVFLGNEK
jgi:NifU-like protein involved in Fe-S cluster formation